MLKKINLLDIDLEVPFVDQEPIQQFLNSSANSSELESLNNLLFLFTEIIRLTVPQLPFQKAQAIKIGYERAVLVKEEAEAYRVESHFIATSNWVSAFDQAILQQGTQFLSDILQDQDLKQKRNQVNPLEEESDLAGNQENGLEEEGNQTELAGEANNDSEIIEILSWRITDEIVRRYPSLDNCKEFHVYIFVGQESLSIGGGIDSHSSSGIDGGGNVQEGAFSVRVVERCSACRRGRKKGYKTDPLDCIAC